MSDLKEKEIVNLCDGGRLGYVCDAEIDMLTGRLVSLSVPPQGGLLGWGAKKEIRRISWEQIEKIGDDIILVRAAELVPPENPGNAG